MPAEGVEEIVDQNDNEGMDQSDGGTSPSPIRKNSRESKELQRLDVHLVEMRLWLEDQPHLPHNISDNLLTSFVMGCKWDMDRIKKRLDNFFKARSLYPHLLADRDPLGESMQAVNKLWYLFDVQDCTNEGFPAIFVRFQDVPSETGQGEPIYLPNYFNDFYRKMLMVMEHGLTSSPFNTNWYYVADMKNMMFSYMSALSPRTLYPLVKTVLEGIPIRLKGIVMFNMPQVLAVAMKGLCRILVKQKIYKRLHIYSTGAECLAEHFKVHLLPIEYGGLNKTLQELNEDCINKMVENRDWFLNGEGSYKSDESKRPKESN